MELTNEQRKYLGLELIEPNWAMDFKNNGIGWSLNVNKTLVEECIKAGTNEPFWKADRGKDLRNPIFSKELAVVLKQMGI